MSRNVVIKDAVKTYGNFNAVDHANLEIQSGELFTLLGPSGCGKTTLLRMIAGFNSIDGGSIAFGETVINDVPAHKRNIGMVFQNYAIFPHMSVFENVAYGLKARKVKKEEIEERVMEALAMEEIRNYNNLCNTRPGRGTCYFGSDCCYEKWCDSAGGETAGDLHKAGK